MARDAGPRKDTANSTWWFAVDLPPAPDGRRRQAKRRGFKTKTEAQAALDELRVTARQATYVPPARQRLSEFLTDDWLPAIKVTIEESIWASYERYLRLHVIPHLGGVRLEAVDAGMLNRLYADLLDHGRLDGKPGGLSRQSVRYVRDDTKQVPRRCLNTPGSEARRWSSARSGIPVHSSGRPPPRPIDRCPPSGRSASSR
ncbi:MAG: Arm DNA-binding domain-containing protein [Acidimicrobiales bacterium]